MTAATASWQRLASSTRLQRSSQCLSVEGSQAWIFGGELLPREPVDNRLDVVRLDAITGRVEAITLEAPAAAPASRVGSATTVVQDAIFLFSGRGGLAMMPVEDKGALWRYTPKQSLWECIEPADPWAPYPAGRSYHAMTSDGHKKIYVHAGCPEKGRLSDLWSFDLESLTWAELPPAPPPARGGTSIAFCGDKLYRMHGFDGNHEQGGAIDVFDVDSCTWSTTAFPPDGRHGPEPRSVSALVAINTGGRDLLVTLFGERDPSSLGHAGAGKMLADVWAFDLERKEWIKIEPRGDAPVARGWFGTDVMQDKAGHLAVVVHGGLAEDNSRLGDVWRMRLE